MTKRLRMTPRDAALKIENIRAAKKVAPDARVRTNALYARQISATPRAGVVVRAHTPISGCWVVRVDDIAPVQYMHENYLEVE